MANTGYWMPFEAAKAIAATFCWKIRYALTPVFGPDFPKMCLRPESDGFGTMVIDHAITQRCTEQSIFYRQLEIQASSGATSVMRSPLTPEFSTIPRQVKRLRPKIHQIADAGSGYNSDSSFEGNYLATPISPAIPYCNTWTPSNTPRSVGPSFHDRLPSPREILAGISAEAAEADEEDHNSADSASTSSTTSLLLKSRQETNDDGERCKDATQGLSERSGMISDMDSVRGTRSDSSVLSDEKAAYLLLKLSMEAGVSDTPRGEKRRASA